MTRSTSWLKNLALAALAFSVFAFAPGSAFAQHGGGGHAGGGGGFGGGHFGGGSSSHSTSSHSTSRPALHTTSTGHPVSSSKSASGNAVVHTPIFRAPAGFGSTGATATPTFTLHGQPSAPRTSVIGFPPSDSHIASVDPALRAGSSPLSFSGQGHQIWQDAPSSARTATLTTRPTPPHRVFPYQPPFAFYPAFGFYPLGFYGGGFCDPFWGSDLALGCGGFGFGLGYGYGGFWGPGYYDNSYSVGSTSGPMDYENDTPSNSYGTYSPAPEQAPDQSTDQSAPPAVADARASETDLYFKDGTSLEVLSYWLDAGKLHYITNYNGEMTIDLSQVDLQRTVDENARHGVDFTLRPNPPAPAQTAPDQQPAPDLQATPQQ